MLSQHKRISEDFIDLIAKIMKKKKQNGLYSKYQRIQINTGVGKNMWEVHIILPTEGVYFSVLHWDLQFQIPKDTSARKGRGMGGQNGILS